MTFKRCVMLHNTTINSDEDCIYYYLNYYKWKDVKNLDKNDIKYRNHSLIYEFKSGTRFHNNPLSYFRTCIEKSLTLSGEWHICVIPNHNQVGNNHTNNLTELLDHCKLQSKFIK